MKIFYAARLFSGFETSIIKRNWVPTGAPTIYKLMEALDSGKDKPFFILSCKENYAPQLKNLNGAYAIQGLRHPIRILGGISGRGRVIRIINEFQQTQALFSFVRRLKPDITYFTNANYLAAALVARFTKVPTVLRIMGVYPAQRKALTGRRVSHAIMRWAYRSPFTCVICTQDGSGGETWLNKAFSPNVRIELMLNGVDVISQLPEIDPRLAGLPKNQTIVTHVGKLEPEKGVREFMEGFLKARKLTNGGLHALVIGTGSLGPQLECRILEERALQDVTFIQRLPHNQMPWVHQKTDIYVSLNRLGNLSNANLEAMKAGSCMIFPCSQSETGIDLVTDRLVPEGAVLRILSTDDVKALVEALVFLHKNPLERDRMRCLMANTVIAFIPSWKERVEKEMRLLHSLIPTIQSQ